MHQVDNIIIFYSAYLICIAFIHWKFKAFIALLMHCIRTRICGCGVCTLYKIIKYILCNTVYTTHWQNRPYKVYKFYDKRIRKETL